MAGNGTSVGHMQGHEQCPCGNVQIMFKITEDTLHNKVSIYSVCFVFLKILILETTQLFFGNSVRVCSEKERLLWIQTAMSAHSVSPSVSFIVMVERRKPCSRAYVLHDKYG
jgi:hypothetical protein